MPGLAEEKPDIATAARLMRTLSAALATVTSRLETQGGTADEVTLLATRAESLAERSRALATLPYPAGGTFSSLAGEIDDFGALAASLAGRAEEEARQSRALALTIRQQLAALELADGQADSDAGKAALRERLEGVLDALAPLSGRLDAVAALATEMSGLGERAVQISEQNGDARGPARLGNSAVVAMCGELRGFADAANAASETLLADNSGIRQVMIEARDRAQAITREVAAPPARPADAAAMVWRARAPAESPETLRGMVWHPKGFGRRSPE